MAHSDRCPSCASTKKPDSLESVKSVSYIVVVSFKRKGIRMKNVELTLGANILTIKVDLTKEFGPSSSGKTIIIASTEGNVSIPGAEDKKIGLNVYKKK